MPLVTEIGGAGSPAPTGGLIGSRGFAGGAACDACVIRGAAAGRAAAGAVVAGRAVGPVAEVAAPFAGRAGVGFNRSPTVWEG